MPDAMTSVERVLNTLNRKPVDHLACAETFWTETDERWKGEGHVKPDEPLRRHFSLDIDSGGWSNLIADLDFIPQTVAEDDISVTRRDGNGALLRMKKKGASTPEHVDFTVKEKTAWEEKIRPFLIGPLDPRRISRDHYRTAKAQAAADDRFFVFDAAGPFECLHPVCGHEHMCVGMAMDPDWIKDMVGVYVDLTIAICEELFALEGAPDGMWFYEDMGFKGRPFISPQMYEEIFLPGHRRLFDYSHSRGLKVICHSCGYVAPLVPGLVEAGIDCLQAMEVKAGMDVIELARAFGDRIAFCGNLDVRELCSNDFSRIDDEMEKKIIPLMENGYSYIVHSDHSIPPDVNYASMLHWYEKARAICASFG